MRVNKGKDTFVSKFGGLPEMIKYSLPGLPPIIDVEIVAKRPKNAAGWKIF